MPTTTRFKLPDVGEGLTEAEILSWEVKVGDTVEVNQILCEIETAKSAVELPSPVAGVIDALHAEEGDTVEVGSVIVSFRMGAAVAEKSPTQPEPAAVVAPAAPKAAEAVAIADDVDSEPDEAEEREVKILVGTGPSKLAARRRHLRPRSELPVDVQHSVVTTAPAVYRGGVERREPIKGVRKATAAAVTGSAFTAPHVTEWLAVDVTETMKLVRVLKSDPQWEGVRVNPMLLVAKALLIAVEQCPEVNARWDESAQEIVYYGHVNLGIAAATPRGLVVPNVKGADQLSFAGLARAVQQLVEVARTGRTRPADLQNGTITITNIGSLGVDAGTPILNPGEAAILAFGAVRPTPWVVDGEIAVRDVTQLALSFDHRLVDGELGSKVLTEVAAVLTNPVSALLRTQESRG